MEGDMIVRFVERFDQSKKIFREKFSEAHPSDYDDLVKTVVEVLSDERWKDEECDRMDPSRIHTIDDGEYQGTLLYVIGAASYQPSRYWYVKVDYGSCSGCDTLHGIRGYDGESPTKLQVDDYMTLALHIVQGLRELA
jgi:hypothetical protein